MKLSKSRLNKLFTNKNQTKKKCKINKKNIHIISNNNNNHTNHNHTNKYNKIFNLKNKTLRHFTTKVTMANSE